MRYEVVPVKNITKLSKAGDALTHRGKGQPGMGIVWGQTGFGKTTAAAWFRNRVDGIYLRAMAVWTPLAMLGALMRELGEPAAYQCAPMMDTAIARLSQTPRPLMIDEADYIIANKKMVETLRDLHDLATAPVVLIGMGGIEKAIKKRQQLTGRIQQWIEFKPADLEDTCILAERLCEVAVGSEVLERLLTQANGNIRSIVIGLANIEERSRIMGIDSFQMKHWAKGDTFFGRGASN